MLFLNLFKLINKVEYHCNHKITLTELSKQTGVHRNTVSALYNNKQVSVSHKSVEKILNYCLSFWLMHEKLNPNWASCVLLEAAFLGRN